MQYSKLKKVFTFCGLTCAIWAAGNSPAHAFFGGSTGCACTTQINSAHSTTRSSINNTIITMQNAIVEKLDLEHYNDRLHHGATIGMLDEGQMNRHQNLLVFLHHLITEAEAFQGRLDNNRAYPGMPDPSDPSYGTKEDGSVNLPQSFCMPAAQSSGAAESAHNSRVVQTDTATTMTEHLFSPPTHAESIALTGTLSPAMMDAQELLLPHHGQISHDDIDHARIMTARLVDWNPVQPMTPDKFTSLKDAELASAINERIMRLEPVNVYMQRNLTSNIATRPLDAGSATMLEHTNFQGKELLVEDIEESSNHISERALLSLNVNYHASSIHYQEQIQSLSGDDLLRQQLLQTAMTNKLLLEKLEEMRYANLIYASATAQEINQSTRPDIQRMRVRSAEFVSPDGSSD